MKRYNKVKNTSRLSACSVCDRDIDGTCGIGNCDYGFTYKRKPVVKATPPTNNLLDFVSRHFE